MAESGKYAKSFDQYGATPQALRWKNYAAIGIRYSQLVADLDIKGKSILDVGCGLGDLLPFLYAKTNDFTYRGVDITPEFIEIAKARFTGHDFQVGDPFEDAKSEKFDIVITSGVLNSSGPENWLEKRKQMVRTLFGLANEALAFNMAGSVREEGESNGIGYANSLEILDFCAKLTQKIILRNQYHPKDFTVVLFK